MHSSKILIGVATAALMASAAVAATMTDDASADATLRVRPKTPRTTTTYPRPARSAAATPITAPGLVGTIEYSGDYGVQYGVYGFDTSTWEWSLLSTQIGDTYCGGGTAIDDGDQYLTIRYVTTGGVNQVTAYVFDTSTWQLADTYPLDQTCIANDLAYDSQTGRVYGCFYNDAGDGWVLGYLDLATRQRTALTSLPTNGYHGLLADDAGHLWALDWDGILYAVDPEDGSAAPVGNTGLEAGYQGSACWDPATGDALWAVNTSDGSSYVCQIDLSNAQATALHSFPDGEEIQGIYVPPTPPSAAAPAAPADVEAAFAGGSLSGTVSFTAPAALYGGGAPDAAESLEYTVSVGNQEVAMGACSWGERVVADVTMTQPGNYRFTVSVANAAGAGPRGHAAAWVGPDTPLAPTDVAIKALDGQRVAVSWQPVTAGVHGGWVDPAAVTYTVVRQPGRVAVATATSQTTVEDVPQASQDDQATSVTYEVTATAGGFTSATATSAPWVLGACSVPWQEDFSTMADTQDVRRTFTIVDANADGTTWEFRSSISGKGGVMRCQYSETLAMDDWLISPPLALEAGKAYLVTVNAYSYMYSTPERFEVMVGAAPTAEAMTQTIIAATDTRNDSQANSDFTGYATVETTGNYYVGVHGISPKDQMWLHVSRMEVSAPIEGATPDQVTGLTLTPDPEGSTAMTLAFTTPARDMMGNNLTDALKRVDVARDGTVAASWTEVPAGQQMTWVDHDPGQAGPHAYTVTAYNAFGAGKPSTVSGYAGINVPAPPAGATVTETSKPGQVALTWQAPTVDVAGFPLQAGWLTYTVAQTLSQGQEGEVVADKATGTSLTLTAVPEDGMQDFVYYSVFANTAGGRQATPAVTAIVPVGRPFTLPYVQSFGAGDAVTYPVSSEVLAGNVNWQTADDNDYGDISSADADDGFMVMFGDAVGASGRMATGKISLQGVAHPQLTFQYYSPEKGCLNSFDVQLRQVGAQDASWQTLQHISCQGVAGWNTATVPLDQWAGKVVRLAIVSTIGSAQYGANMVDDVKVVDLLGHNLHAASLEAPLRWRPGRAQSVRAVIDNYGSSAVGAGDYAVALLCDGQDVLTAPGVAVEPGGRVAVQMDFAPSSLVQGSELELSARVDFAADQDAGDNATPSVAVQMLTDRALPTVANLRAQRVAGSNDVQLVWDDPQDAYDTEVTDGFEDAFSMVVPDPDVPGWTFHDQDGVPVGPWTYINNPGLNGPVSWFAVDQDDPALKSASYFAAHSGRRSLTAMYAYDTETSTSPANDDWAVSPRLSGAAQTLTFWAKSWSMVSPETFQVMASSTGTAVEDFKALAAPVTMKASGWQQYTYQLPAGTLYFALRYLSEDCMMLMVDDVTYTPGHLDAAVTGYRVYRNGRAVTPAQYEGLDFLDQDAPEGEPLTYQVTMLYDGRGESAPCAPVTLEAAGVDGAMAGPDGASVAVTGGRGVITVTGAATGVMVTVATPAGMVVSRTEATCAEALAIPCAPGIYVVRAGATAAKVMVR